MRHILKLLLPSLCFLNIGCLTELEVRKKQWDRIAENAIAYGKPKDTKNFYAPVGETILLRDETMILLTIQEKFEQKNPGQAVIEAKAENGNDRVSSSYSFLNGVWISHQPKPQEAEKELP